MGTPGAAGKVLVSVSGIMSTSSIANTSRDKNLRSRVLSKSANAYFNVKIIKQRAHCTLESILASRPAALGSILGVHEFFQSSMLPRFIDSALLSESGQCKKLNS